MLAGMIEIVRSVLRWLLAAFLVFAGSAHFWMREEFRAQVPRQRM